MNKKQIEDFELLLGATKKLVLENLALLPEPATMSGVVFETLVANQMTVAAIGTPFEGTVRQTGLQTFPDILLVGTNLGVEVKATSGNKWISTGNSILETTRDKSVTNIYMFFGKLGGTPDILYRSYQECLTEIVATHSPRYLIDMGQGAGESIFERMKVTYDEFRADKPINRAQKYYKSLLKKGEQLWWLSTDEAGGNDEPSTSLVIKQYRDFDINQKNMFVSQVMMLFPEVFTSNSLSYREAAAFLLAEYGAVHASMRDAFTAGGVFKVKLRGESYILPHIYAELFLNAKTIQSLLMTSDVHLEEHWGASPALELREQSWLDRSKKVAKELPYPDAFEDIYRQGLAATT